MKKEQNKPAQREKIENRAQNRAEKLVPANLAAIRAEDGKKHDERGERPENGVLDVRKSGGRARLRANRPQQVVHDANAHPGQHADKKNGYLLCDRKIHVRFPFLRMM